MAKERRSEGLLHTFNLTALWKSAQKGALHLRTTDIYTDFPYFNLLFQLKELISLLQARMHLLLSYNES